MRKKTALLSFLFFTGLWASAQSMYEVNFYFEKTGVANQKIKPDRQAFYILNGDGTGTMRMNISDTTGLMKLAADCGIKSGYPKDDRGNFDFSRIFYAVKNITPLSADTAGMGIIRDTRFWFKKNTATGFFEPAMMTTRDETGKEIPGVMISYRLLGTKDLTRDFVLRYYTKQDDLYQNLFETDSRGGPDEFKNAKLYFLAVIDTEDSTIGNDCKKDLANQTAYFARIAKTLGIEMIPKQLLGKQLSRVNVLKMLKQVNPTSIDILVFYYSGHGYSREDERLFPYMDLRVNKKLRMAKQDQLSVEEVFDSVVNSKKARLNLVISDCCNWHPTAVNAQSPKTFTHRGETAGYSLENIRTLFMNTNRVSLLMTAAAKGQVSAGNSDDGGLFTSQFRDALDKYMSNNFKGAQWDTVAESIQEQTTESASYGQCEIPGVTPKTYRICEQTPMFKFDPRQ